MASAVKGAFAALSVGNAPFVAWRVLVTRLSRHARFVSAVRTSGAVRADDIGGPSYSGSIQLTCTSSVAARRRT